MRLRLLPLAAAGFLTVAAGAAAAQTVSEIVITPRLGPDGRPTQLSRGVPFGDLDLRTVAGQDVLKARVRDTARDLCRELGEDRSGPSPLAQTCIDRAIAGSREQVRVAIADSFAGRYAVAPAVVPPAADAAAIEPDDEVDDTPDAAAAATDVSATASAPVASFTATTVTNGPVPDTPENRARLGGPDSRAGRQTSPASN